MLFQVQEGQERTAAIVVFKESAADLHLNADFTLEFDATLAPQPCITVDGTAESAYGASRATQAVQTQFGDADRGQLDEANGSELNELWATFCDDTLYLTLSGNLQSNYNDLELFLDTCPGGQKTWRGDNPDFVGGDDFNRMGDDGSGNGFTFEPGFEADWWFSFQGGFGEPRAVDLGNLPGRQYATVCLGTSTGVEDETPWTDVTRIALLAPAPNPFNPRTTIHCALPEMATVTIDLFDVAGRRVRGLVAGEGFGAGEYALIWDGTDAHGQRVASGTYLVRMNAGGEEHTRRVTLLK